MVHFCMDPTDDAVDQVVKAELEEKCVGDNKKVAENNARFFCLYLGEHVYVHVECHKQSVAYVSGIQWAGLRLCKAIKTIYNHIKRIIFNLPNFALNFHPVAFPLPVIKYEQTSTRWLCIDKSDAAFDWRLAINKQKAATSNSRNKYH